MYRPVPASEEPVSSEPPLGQKWPPLQTVGHVVTLFTTEAWTAYVYVWRTVRVCLRSKNTCRDSTHATENGFTLYYRLLAYGDQHVTKSISSGKNKNNGMPDVDRARIPGNFAADGYRTPWLRACP